MSQQIRCDALHHGSAISIIQATVGDSDSHEEKESEVPKAALEAVVAEERINASVQGSNELVVTEISVFTTNLRKT